MSREKFVFNPNTLRYEKVHVSLRERFLYMLGFTSAVIISAMLLLFLAYNYFPSPKEKLLMNEIDNMKAHYSTVTDQLEFLSKIVDNVQDRDAQLHRTLLGIDPIDESIWNGGIGGHVQYEELKQYQHTGELLSSTLSKVDKLKRQINLQSISLDTLLTLAEKNEDRFASIPSIKPVREDKLKRNVKLLSGYGMRIHPIHKIRKMHAGIDFTAPTGTPIQATGNGRVIEVKRSKRGYGRHVKIDHGYGYETLYGHMASIDVKKGEKVVRGQQIGTVGSTGTSTAPHCHYEVRYQGKTIDPINYVLDGLTPAEYQELVEKASVINQSLDYLPD